MKNKYQAGEHIVYDNYGVCLIKDIKEMSLVHGVPRKDYYILSPVNASQSTYYVPCDNEALTSKMRNPLTENEIHNLLKNSEAIILSWTDNRQQRAEISREILKNGINVELIALIRCLYERKLALRANGKKLSATDEGILLSCERMINDEFSFSLGISSDTVPEYIRSFMKEQ